MKIEEQVYYEILNSNISLPYESGGLLGGSDNIVSKYCIDVGTAHGETYYCPDVAHLNYVIREWIDDGVTLYGFFHTHPLGNPNMSCGDKEYALSILRAMSPKTKKLLFPVVIPGVDIIFYRGELIDNEIVFSRENTILVKIKKGETL